jgi:hypothetical protein
MMYDKEIRMVIIKKKNIKIFKVENIVPTLTLFFIQILLFLLNFFSFKFFYFLIGSFFILI